MYFVTQVPDFNNQVLSEYGVNNAFHTATAH